MQRAGASQISGAMHCGLSMSFRKAGYLYSAPDWTDGLPPRPRARVRRRGIHKCSLNEFSLTQASRVWLAFAIHDSVFFTRCCTATLSAT